jgi:succinate dehydrogenase / fumarate reductase membrane anchor subunit
MSHNKHALQSDLGRARGLGSSHHGVGHWWHQRVTAIANIPLMLWLVWSVINMPGWSFEQFTTWLAAPINAVLMILAVISVFYHAALGTQVIAEDYIHTEWMKIAKLLCLRLFFLAGAVACIFSILKIAFA